MNKFECLHETPIRAAIDLIDIFKKTDVEDILDATKRSPYASSSIARIASNMTLVFPVMCSNTLHIDTCMMIMKAVERKCAVMLQILFSAYQVTDVKDAQEFISRFHSNIRVGNKATVDDFIALGDALSETTSLRVDRDIIGTLSKDFRENCYFVLEDDISPVSIEDRYNGIKEAAFDANYWQKERFHRDDMAYKIGKDIISGFTREREREEDRAERALDRAARAKEREEDREERRKQRQEDRDARAKEREEDREERRKQRQEDRDARYEENRNKNMADLSTYFKNQILPSDVKKANELAPLAMIVNFTTINPKTGRAVPVENVVIGIKARFIPVDSDDIINHLLTKLNDKNFIVQLIRATTREISFFKDFVLAIDNAKIEALANSKRGSANPMWKVLERRAAMSRLNRFVGVRGNNANAITTLVVSQEEIDYVKKNHGKNFDSIKTINILLDAYNLMGFAIADESLEVVKFKFDDGENFFETLAFSSLEKEASDNSYKKIVNLMTKLA